MDRVVERLRLVKRFEELADELRRVPDQQHPGTVAGEEPFRRLVDLLAHTGSLVDDEQQVLGVVALERLELVR